MQTEYDLGYKRTKHLEIICKYKFHHRPDSQISINIDGYSPASFEVTQKGTSVPQTTEDMEINAKVDEYLKMYLWNDEYKTLNLDHNKGYEDFFYDALGSMTTNTLDKNICR